MTDKLEFVFVEVDKFRKSEEELETDLDKWVFLLKNLSNLLERPKALRDKIFTRIFDAAEFAKLDNAEQKEYVKAMNNERELILRIQYATEKGLDVIHLKKSIWVTSSCYSLLLRFHKSRNGTRLRSKREKSFLDEGNQNASAQEAIRG